jgi:hypothetical protein
VAAIALFTRWPCFPPTSQVKSLSLESKDANPEMESMVFRSAAAGRAKRLVWSRHSMAVRQLHVTQLVDALREGALRALEGLRIDTPTPETYPAFCDALASGACPALTSLELTSTTDDPILDLSLLAAALRARYALGLPHFKRSRRRAGSRRCWGRAYAGLWRY